MLGGTNSVDVLFNRSIAEPTAGEEPRRTFRMELWKKSREAFTRALYSCRTSLTLGAHCAAVAGNTPKLHHQTKSHFVNLTPSSKVLIKKNQTTSNRTLPDVPK